MEKWLHMSECGQHSLMHQKSLKRQMREKYSEQAFEGKWWEDVWSLPGMVEPLLRGQHECRRNQGQSWLASTLGPPGRCTDCNRLQGWQWRGVEDPCRGEQLWYCETRCQSTEELGHNTSEGREGPHWMAGQGELELGGGGNSLAINKCSNLRTTFQSWNYCRPQRTSLCVRYRLPW